MASASIESLITCSICFERFTAPKTLPCEHSFCSHCLARTVASNLVKNDVLDTSKDITITCPICKDCVQGYQTISDIKNSLILKQLMDAHVADNEGMGGPACNCKRDAKFQCLDCDTRLCECCFKIPYNSCITNHFMSQISKNDSDEYLCVSHGISLDFFCTFCKIPVCLDCCMVSHKQHDVMTVSSQIKNKDEQIATCKQILDEYNSNCEALQEKEGMMIKIIKEKGDSFAQTLHQLQMNVMTVIIDAFEQANQSVHFHVLKAVSTIRNFVDEATGTDMTTRSLLSRLFSENQDLCGIALLRLGEKVSEIKFKSENDSHAIKQKIDELEKVRLDGCQGISSEFEEIVAWVRNKIRNCGKKCVNEKYCSDENLIAKLDKLKEDVIQYSLQYKDGGNDDNDDKESGAIHSMHHNAQDVQCIPNEQSDCTIQPQLNANGQSMIQNNHSGNHDGLTSLDVMIFQSELCELLDTSLLCNQEIMAWIEMRVNDELKSSKEFIQALAVTIYRRGIGLPGSKLHVTSVRRYAPLLHTYTLNETEKELQLLLAAERLSEALDHPPDFLKRLFKALHQESIVNINAMELWKNQVETRPSPPKNELKRVFTVISFFQLAAPTQVLTMIR